MKFSALTRRFQTTLALLFVSALTACGGGGAGGSGTLPSTTGAQPQASASPAPMQIISQNGTSITLAGAIVALIAGGFEIQGGRGVGYLHVYTNSSTVITGPALFVGEDVEITGTGTVSTSITATSVSQLNPTPAPSASIAPTTAPTATPTVQGSPATPIPLPSGVVTATGQIVAITGAKMTIQAGVGCGSMYVYTNASTTYFDGTPQVGEYGAFTGPGARCNAVTANAVSLSATPLTSGTTGGTVAAATSYGFTINTGSATIPVALPSTAVIFGSTLSVGSRITLTALGTSATGLSATQIAVAPPPTPTPNPSASPTPTPAPISLTHVQNFAYIYGYGGTPTTIPISAMSPWVNWAMTDEQHAAALRAGGVKIQVYSNFWRNYSGDNPNIGYTDLEPGGAHSVAEATDCSGAAVYDSRYGGGYEADARSSSALAHAQVVANYRLGEYAGNYDALFADDSGAVWGITVPCNYDEAAYDSAVNAVHSALGVPMWINALGAAPNPADAVDLLQPSNVLGAMCEICYSVNGTTDSVQTGASWQNIENAEIGTIAQHKVFWDYGRATGPAATETALRIYTYASFLLTYDPNYTMFQEALSTPSGFPVMPETALVPMNPLTTQSNVSGYQAPGGSYMREFGACYYQGTFVSNCAVVVNSSAAPVPVPTTSYSHALVLSGAGVLDGGSVTFNGAAPSQLAPRSAAILFP